MADTNIDTGIVATTLRIGGDLKSKLIADAEILCRVAIVAGIGGLTIPQDVFNVGADVAALTAAVGVAGRAVLHKLGEMLTKA